jgi:predicted regulator of Ras-like GTPase activity (Roadblock/LC7/MglB family)
VVGLRAMDAAQALADLTEISAQIEAAVLADEDGSLLGSTFKQSGRGEAVAGAAIELLKGADEARAGGDGQGLVQLQVATPEGSVFVVRDGGRAVAAVTRGDPTVGLVFYDLKTCLRLLEQDEERAAAAVEPAAAKPAARRRKKKEETEEAAGGA